MRAVVVEAGRGGGGRAPESALGLDGGDVDRRGWARAQGGGGGGGAEGGGGSGGVAAESGYRRCCCGWRDGGGIEGLIGVRASQYMWCGNV